MIGLGFHLTAGLNQNNKKKIKKQSKEACQHQTRGELKPV